MRGGGGSGSYHVLGLYILKPIAWLMAGVLFVSALGSLMQRGGLPVLRLSVLTVDGVWAGEVWRLLTWALVELSALGLVFGLLLLYFIGPDLLRQWGGRRFFALYFGGAAVVGALTCLVGRYVWSEVAAVPHLGLWPMEEAMLIAWASLYRDRQILLYFALPVAGRNLIALTIGITVVMGALGGFHHFVPHFIAELSALAYMNGISVRPWVARAKLAWFQQRYKRRTARLVGIDREEPPRWTH
jgi:membrane associated rhomboid family serine protease